MKRAWTLIAVSGVLLLMLGSCKPLEIRALIEDIVANAGGGGGTARSWLGPVRVAISAAAADPQVDIAENGAAIVAWRDDDKLAAIVYTPSAGWNAGFTRGAPGIGLPAVSMEPSGDGLVAWSELDGAIDVVYGKAFLYVTGWQTDEKIGVESIANSDQPDVALSGTGVGWAVWRGDSGTGSTPVVKAMRYYGGWSGTAMTLSGNHNDSPQVGMDDLGKALAVWSDYDNAPHRIMGDRNDGTWLGVFQVANPGPDVSLPVLAVSPGGKAVAAFQDMFNDEVYAAIYSGSWGSSNKVFIGSAPLGDDPRVAVSSTPVCWVVVVDSSVIWVNKNQGGWSGAMAVADGSSADIAIDESDVAILVYRGTDGYIYAKRFSQPDGWGSSETISNGPGSSPRVAMTSDGKGIAVWEQDADIYANRFE